jgi:hypothetical protein
VPRLPQRLSSEEVLAQDEISGYPNLMICIIVGQHLVSEQFAVVHSLKKISLLKEIVREYDFT